MSKKDEIMAEIAEATAVARDMNKAVVDLSMAINELGYWNELSPVFNKYLKQSEDLLVHFKKLKEIADTLDDFDFPGDTPIWRH